MSHAAFNPIFLLSFANAPDHVHLDELRRESGELRDILLPLHLGGQIDLQREESAENRDLPRLFTLFGGRLFLFHFGGHAEGRQLMFEDEAGHVRGMTELLRRSPGLKLAFLNGCATQAQVFPYLDSGVAAVIVTTCPVADGEARRFAAAFYRGLAAWKTVREAFREAVAAAHGAPEEGIIVLRGIRKEFAETAGPPWRLYVQETQRSILDWVIPEGVEGERRVLVILAASADYQAIRQRTGDLLGRIADKTEQLGALPEGPPEGPLAKLRQELERQRLELGAALEREQEKERQFKQEVIRLAESFERLDIDTQRLREAYAHFRAGRIREADALLQAGELATEQDELLAARDRRRRELDELEAQLRHNAAEYLIKARLTISLRGEKQNWYEEAAGFFERSLRAATTFDNLVAYATFRQEHHDYRHALELYLRLSIPALTADQQAIAHHNTAMVLQALGRFDEARQHYETAAAGLRSLAEKDPQNYRPELARTLNNLGLLYQSMRLFPQANGCYEEALSIRRDLRPPLPAGLAHTLNNLANLYLLENRFTEARKRYEEALAIQRPLAAADPGNHLADLARTLNNLGELCRLTHAADAAEAYTTEAVALFRQLAKVNPRAFLPNVAQALNNQGNSLYLAHKEQAARHNYEEALAIQRQLAAADPAAFRPDLAKFLHNLGALHLQKGNYEEAFPFLMEALTLRRELAAAAAGAYRPELARTLQNLGVLHKNRKHYPEAMICLEEARAIYRTLTAAQPAAYRPDLAAILVNLGNIYADAGRPGEARPAYEEALDHYRELARANAAAFLPNYVLTLINLGRFHLDNAPDHERSLACTREAIRLLIHYMGGVPAATGYLTQALTIIRDWGLDPKAEIEKGTAE